LVNCSTKLPRRHRIAGAAGVVAAVSDSHREIVLSA
jgi:hypothetical protein